MAQQRLDAIVDLLARLETRLEDIAEAVANPQGI